jgi:hypothetical protein
VLFAPALAIGDEHRNGTRARDQYLRERGPAIAEHRIVHERRRVRALDVEQDREDERRHETGEADGSGGGLADRPPGEDGDHQQQARRAEQRQHRCKREPVDVRFDDHRPRPCVIEV